MKKRNAQELHEIDAYVARRLRQARMMKGTSQELLGDTMYISFQQIQKYERAMNRISAGKLFHLAEVLGTEINSFFPGTGNKDSLNLSKREIELLRLFRGMENRELRRTLLAFLKEVNKSS